MLIYNRQTEGAVPEQLRAAAEQAGVPVVEVTETVAARVDGASSTGRSTSSAGWRPRWV